MITAFEINHFLWRKTVGKKCHFSLKIDMSKAYDRMEWRGMGWVIENTSQIRPFGRLLDTPTPQIYGKIFGTPGVYLNWGLDGKLVMGAQSRFEMTGGSRGP